MGVSFVSLWVFVRFLYVSKQFKLCMYNIIVSFRMLCNQYYVSSSMSLGAILFDFEVFFFIFLHGFSDFLVFTPMVCASRVWQFASLL